jgi:hypothetical protein
MGMVALSDWGFFQDRKNVKTSARVRPMPVSIPFPAWVKTRYADPQATRRRKMQRTIREDHRNF